MLGFRWRGETTLGDASERTQFTKGRSPWPFDRRRYSLRQRYLLKNDRKALERGIGGVLDAARMCGCDESATSDLEVAAREALTNAMLHGNRADPHKWVRLRLYGCPTDALLVVISDEGNGFDPAKVPDPRDPERLELSHGRGLLFMRELVDHVEYRKGGREVVLFKAVTA